jgi:pimeloyl-ACP methyl ester carboxylesterase
MSDNAPVLLIHGLASTFEHNWKVPGWVDLLEAEGREIIGVNLPGHGPDPADPATTDAADVVAAAISGYDAIDAVGFSAGANLLLRVAARDPGRFRKVVAIGVGNSIVEPAAAADQPGAGELLDDTSDSAMSQLFMRMLVTAGNTLEGVRGYTEYGRTHPQDPPDLSRITCPTLVVIGDRDFMAPADKLAAALPASALIVLKGVDHFGAINDFACLDAVLTFLTE